MEKESSKQLYVYYVLMKKKIGLYLYQFIVFRKIMMGVGNRVASVIMLTFPSEPCPHADGQLGCDWLSWLAKAVVGLFQGVDDLC